jgi:RNA polymerase sigma-70 factor (ECF subfamily)
VTATITEHDFATATDPLRGELTAHCYRMLGSVHDAEDQVQETYLRAWRAFHAFEGRSSVRTWMYQIATRTCLTALEQRGRRPMPTGLGAPSSDPVGPLESRPEVPWLEPVPDALVTAPGADPATVAATRDSVRLAFVAALQFLTPLQRAVLILRDVLAFSAAETARTLDITVAAANSALQRARAGVERHPRRTQALTLSDLDAHGRGLLKRYMVAFERYDTDAFVALLRHDATWEMPPFTGWYAGSEAIGTLIRSQCPAQAADDMRLVAIRANGQPACAMWMKGPDGVHRAFQIQVLDVVRSPDGPAVAHVSAFFDVALFDAFGLPQVWRDDLVTG